MNNVRLFGGKSPLEKLLKRFTNSGASVFLEKVGNDYTLYQRIAAQRYWSIYVRSRLTTGGKTLNLNDGEGIREPVVYVDQNHASLVYSGTAWNLNLAGSGFGGTYSRSATTAGSVVTWTTPDNVTMVGALTYAYINCGISLVTIDGDDTLADNLPTAQDLVDAGTLPNTALKANGGLLDPTDRVWDEYSAAYRTLPVFTRNLTAGVHTVVITSLGYKNAASGNTQIYLDGVFYQTPTTELAAGTAYHTLAVATICPDTYGTEYVTMPLPDGATHGDVWIGGGHGYENQTALQVKIDGAVVAPAAWTMYAGALIEIERSTELFHPDLGATVIGTCEAVYTLNPHTGLWLDYAITWAVDGVMKAAFAAMAEVSNFLDRGSSLLSASDYNLSTNDGHYHPNLKDRCFYMWDADGIYAKLIYVPDLITATNNWISDPNYYFAIQDRSDGLVNKFYLFRVETGSDEAFSITDVWRGTQNTRLRQFANANMLAKGAAL